jgi:hypothetical protein
MSFGSLGHGNLCLTVVTGMAQRWPRAGGHAMPYWSRAGPVANLRRPLPTPVTHAPTSDVSDVSAVLPLAVLEAMRGLDRPTPDAFDEVHGELTAKRLGLSRTVSAEIERLERLGRRGDGVAPGELGALLRLAARRQDAALVFSEAGRRAARRAVLQLPALVRAGHTTLPDGLRHSLGLVLARRIATHVFGTTLSLDAGVPVATLAESHARVTEPGLPCGFFAAALAELLRQTTAFDGAMVHVACRGRGDARCTWRAATLHD